MNEKKHQFDMPASASRADLSTDLHSASRSETVACRLTAPMPAALATLSVSGPDAERLVGSCIRTKRHDAPEPSALTRSQPARIHFARWPLLDGRVSEDVVVCTVDSQTVEIHCHGGVAVSNAILESLKFAGCRLATPASDVPESSFEVFSERNIRRTAERALMETTSDRAAGILLDQWNGALFRSIDEIQTQFLKGDAEAAKTGIDRLLQWGDLGLHLSTPWNIVLAGPPNVGKSSLINALSGTPQAIVHDQPGTTRDWIEAHTQIDGWPVRLKDTAGLRDTDDEIECEGVRRARQQIASADLVLIVIDSTLGWTNEHDQIITLCSEQPKPPRLLSAWNKSDLVESDPVCRPRELLLPTSRLAIATTTCSAVTGIDALLQSIATLLVPASPIPGTAMPFTLEQMEWLRRRLVG